MKILVLNAGSSSVKFSVSDLSRIDSVVLQAELCDFTSTGCQLHYRLQGDAGTGHVDSAGVTFPASARNLKEAIASVPHHLNTLGFTGYDAIGHRVPHGGLQFQQATRLDASVLEQIAASTPLAPLHNPASLEAIRLAMSVWPEVPQVAVFDTAFHHTLPEHAYTYAVPKAWRDAGLRRYGFHGSSHQHASTRAAYVLGKPVGELRMINCHLGNGASVCAIDRGVSVDTSMGFTPLEGLVMGTRSGDVDPGIYTWAQHALGLSANEVEHQLNTVSGLYALAGTNDLCEIERRAAAGDCNAQLAIRLYAYRVRKTIGAYAAVMAGLDVLIFTGGIGEGSALMRRRVCDRLGFLGLELDPERNESARVNGLAVLQLQRADSRVRVLVTQAGEHVVIANETAKRLTQVAGIRTGYPLIPVSVSARHVHLSQAAVDVLFGPGYQLQAAHALYQPSGWAAEETVDIIGPDGQLQAVRVLGPVRPETQIEVSRTDARALGVEVPLRQSGHVENTPQVVLRGPLGTLETRGMIVAARHIHMCSSDAEQWGVHDGDCVDVRVGSGDRVVTFDQTRVRVKDEYVTEMHIDTDEANAAGLSAHGTGCMLTHSIHRPLATP